MTKITTPDHFTRSEPTEAQIRAAARIVYPEFDRSDYGTQTWAMQRALEWHRAWQEAAQ